MIIITRTRGLVDTAFGWKVLLSEIIWRLQFQFQQQGILTITYHLYPVMGNKIGTIYSSGLNKRFSTRFYVGYRVRQETPEKGRRIYRLKCCEYKNKDEANSTNILRDNNYQALFRKFRQIITRYIEPTSNSHINPSTNTKWKWLETVTTFRECILLRVFSVVIL